MRTVGQYIGGGGVSEKIFDASENVHPLKIFGAGHTKINAYLSTKLRHSL